MFRENFHILFCQNQRIWQKRLSAHKRLIFLLGITVFLQPVHSVDDVDIKSLKKLFKLTWQLQHFSLREPHEFLLKLIFLLLQDASSLLTLGKLSVRTAKELLHVPLLLKIDVEIAHNNLALGKLFVEVFLFFFKIGKLMLFANALPLLVIDVTQQ